jgi:hypothetical protein
MAQDFGYAYYGHFGVVGDDFYSCGAHLGAAHAEEFYVGAGLERGGQAGGVHVSAGFACGE